MDALPPVRAGEAGRVLVAYDEAPVRRACRTTLERAGHPVLEAADAATALATAAGAAVGLVVAGGHLRHGEGSLVRALAAPGGPAVLALVRGGDAAAALSARADGA